MKIIRFIVAVLGLSAVVLSLSGCSYDGLESAIVPEAEEEFAKDYLNKVRMGDFDYAIEHLHPELLMNVSREKLEEVSAYFPTGEPVSVDLVGFQMRATNSKWQGNFTFEYEFEEGWAMANTVLLRVDDDLKVLGFNVYRMEASQAEINKFTLQGKSLLHYVVLIGATVVPVFILFTLVVCIRTPIPQRKWLWIIFILLGVGSFQLNWTTGQYAIQALTINLLGATVFASGKVAPWVLSFGVPLGAITFWSRRKEFLMKHEASKTSEDDL